MKGQNLATKTTATRALALPDNATMEQVLERMQTVAADRDALKAQYAQHIHDMATEWGADSQRESRSLDAASIATKIEAANRVLKFLFRQFNEAQERYNTEQSIKHTVERDRMYNEHQTLLAEIEADQQALDAKKQTAFVLYHQVQAYTNMGAGTPLTKALNAANAIRQQASSLLETDDSK